MPYRLETETRITQRIGPKGIIRWPGTIRQEVMEIHACEGLEVLSADGVKVGSATIKDDTLEVKPEGNVRVYLGGSEVGARLEDKNEIGEKRITPWAGASVTTNKDLTIRTEDKRQKVHFRRVETQ